MQHSETEVSRQIAAAGAGSTEALGVLLESYRNYLLAVAEAELDSALRVKVAASDLVQFTFLEAHRGFARFRGTTEEELQAWLRRMLLNNLADQVREHRHAAKRNLARELPLPLVDWRHDGWGAVLDAGSSPSSALALDESRAALEDALTRLPEHYRETIRLRHQEQLDFGEIGRRLARSADAARKLWARAIEQLRREFEDGTQSPG